MISVEKLHLVQMERVETKKMQHDYTADFTVDIYIAIVTWSRLWQMMDGQND